jgi:hypothetical protein
MPTQYPETFPQPLLQGFSMSVASGVIRSDMDTHQAQRRVFSTMPHVFSMSFILSLVEWDAWARWVAEYGFRWFEIEIPTMYAGRETLDKKATLIRLTAVGAAAPVSGQHVQIAVTAEIAPSAIADYIENAP